MSTRIHFVIPRANALPLPSLGAIFAFLLSFVLCVPEIASAALKHRYSFNETSGTTVSDSVGGATGTVIGPGEWTLDGQLRLTSANNAGPYVNLPNHLISGLVNVSFEGWVTWNGGGVWQRVFDIGNNSGGLEDSNGEGLSYLYFTPYSGLNSSRFVMAPAYYYNEPLFVASTTTFPREEQVYFAISYDFQNQIVRYFLNGQLVSFVRRAIPLREIVDINVWLGRSNYTVDHTLNGLYNEFRIYDHALSAAEVALNYAAGPDRLGSELGACESITLELPEKIMVGQKPIRLWARFANAPPVDVSQSPDVAYTIEDGSVASISGGLVTALKAGETTLTAAFQGKQHTQPLTVTGLQASLRYTFNEAAGPFSADQMGGSPARIVGNASFAEGKVTLPGGGPGGPYIDLPNGIISKQEDVTIEVWTTWDGSQEPWQRIFDFGANTGGYENNNGNGTSYLMITPRIHGDPANTELVGGQPVLRGPPLLTVDVQAPGYEPLRHRYGPSMPSRVEVHLAMVYSYSTRTMRVFLDGTEIISGPAVNPLSAIHDYNNRLGRSNWTADPTYAGSYNEFRIYPATLSAEQINAVRELGPDDDGILNGIELVVDSHMKPGSEFQGSVRAHYTRKVGSVTPGDGVTFSSSDPSVVEVTSSGLIRAIQLGQAVITARYGAFEDLQSVTVYEHTSAILKHRYTFRDSVGSQVIQDVVGNAHGVIMGGVALSGLGTASFDGVNGYIDLPNRIISRLTNATFETWFTWKGGGRWQRIFDFGNTHNGEDQGGIGNTYMFLTPWSGDGTSRFAISDGDASRESFRLNTEALELDTPVHMAVTYDWFAGQAALYVNGEEKARGAITIPLKAINDLNNWLGRSNWPDPYLNGVMEEFRIYDGAMSPEEVAASYLAGPDMGLEPLPGIKIISILLLPTGDTQLLLESPFGQFQHLLETNDTLDHQTWMVEENALFTEAENNRIQVDLRTGELEKRFFRIRKLDF